MIAKTERCNIFLLSFSWIPGDDALFSFYYIYCFLRHIFYDVLGDLLPCARQPFSRMWVGIRAISSPDQFGSVYLSSFRWWQPSITVSSSAKLGLFLLASTDFHFHYATIFRRKERENDSTWNVSYSANLNAFLFSSSILSLVRHGFPRNRRRSRRAAFCYRQKGEWPERLRAQSLPLPCK